MRRVFRGFVRRCCAFCARMGAVTQPFEGHEQADLFVVTADDDRIIESVFKLADVPRHVGFEAVDGGGVVIFRR